MRKLFIWCIYVDADISKYKYSGYGIGFDGHGIFLFASGGFGQKVIIFGVAMSSYAHADNKEKYSLILNINGRKKLFN